MDHYELVVRAYDELKHEGKIKKRDDQKEVEEDKGLITRRAGYYINLVDPTIGILEKKTGNNSKGYSVDLLIKTDGTFWDVVTDEGGNAKPINGDGKIGLDLIDKWREPTKELAGLEEDEGEVEVEVITKEELDQLKEELGQFLEENSILKRDLSACIEDGTVAVNIIKDKEVYIIGLVNQIHTLHKEKEDWLKPKNIRAEVRPKWASRLGITAVIVEVEDAK